MFWIQEVGMDYVVKPLNYVYCSILPKPLINGIDDALGDRITWFSAGAHCGMFYTPEFKQEVLERLNCNSKP